MRHVALLLATASLALAGCGGDGDGGSAPKEETPGPPPPAAQKTDTSGKEDAGQKDGGGEKRSGTEVIAAGSEFGEMLYGADKQAIYIFENDPEGESACYDECAEAWPPVYTDGAPQAGEGVRAGLLGTTERRDGRKQVTYNGKPLYFYANEEPGEVRCHNIDLNGGLWWVIGPDGERRP